MSDQCLQYKEDYEKLLELKQEFDEALAAGNKTRGLGEVMRLKDEMEKVLRNLELDLKFKIWKTIELGTGLKTADDFIGAFEVGGYKTDKDAKYILGQPGFTVLSEKIKFELVIISTAGLGFPKGATLEEIYKRAREIGLELCPPEVGPQLRLQYKNQPEREWLNIAMETIKNTRGYPSVFDVGRGAVDPRLCARHARPSDVWGAGGWWVFARRKL